MFHYDDLEAELNKKIFLFKLIKLFFKEPFNPLTKREGQVFCLQEIERGVIMTEVLLLFILSTHTQRDDYVETLLLNLIQQYQSNFNTPTQKTT